MCLRWHVFYSEVFFTNLSWLPGYLVKERGYTVIKSGVYLALPYVAALCGALTGGYLGDRTGVAAQLVLLRLPDWPGDDWGNAQSGYANNVAARRCCLVRLRRSLQRAHRRDL